jgi:hypothetical protein
MKGFFRKKKIVYFLPRRSLGEGGFGLPTMPRQLAGGQVN